MKFVQAAILFFAGLGLFAWSGWEYIAGTTGTQATAVVDHCTKTYGRKGRSHTTCYGSWQEAGVTRTGTIDGVGTDDQGKTVAVRLHDGDAYVFSWAGILVPAGGGVLLLGGFAFWLRSAVKGKQTTPPAPAQRWQPGQAQHPQAPYPPQGHPQPGHPQPGYPLPGQPPQGYPQPGQPPQGYPQPGQPPQSYPQPGYPQPGYPQPGYPQPSYGAPYPQVPVQYAPPPGYPPAQYPPPGYPPR